MFALLYFLPGIIEKTLLYMCVYVSDLFGVGFSHGTLYKSLLWYDCVNDKIICYNAYI